MPQDDTQAPEDHPAGPSRYLTSDAIAAELGLSHQTVRSYFASGALAGSRTGPNGRWQTTRAALDDFVLGRRPVRIEDTINPRRPDRDDQGPDGLGPLETKAGS